MAGFSAAGVRAHRAAGPVGVTGAGRADVAVPA
jgi:hypothetical protein